MQRPDDAPRLPIDPRATTASRRRHVFGWPLALGVVVVLAGVSAVAWRMRVAPDVRDMRSNRHDHPAEVPSRAASPVQAASGPTPAPPTPRVAASPDVATAGRSTTSNPRPASMVEPRDDAPTMQPVANDASDLLRGEVSASVAVAMQAAELPTPPTPLPTQSGQPVEALALPDAVPTGDAADAAPVLGENDEPLDAQPPATADSMPVQQAWLQRIAELDAAGDVAGARQSLAVFRQRFPEVAIPEGLRALEP